MRTISPDLLLTDLVMLGMGGLEPAIAIGRAFRTAK